MPDPIASPAGPIETVTHQGTSEAKPVDTSGSKPISAAERLGLREKGKILGPKDALGSAATPVNTVKGDIKRLRERHSPKTVVPRADVPAPAVPATDKTGRDHAEDGKFVAKAKPAKAAPEETTSIIEGSETPVEAKPVKIKIDDREMTQEEIAAEIKSLREKADKPKVEEKHTLTEAETAAEHQKLQDARQKFIDGEIAREDDIDDKMLDQILTGGPEAVKEFKRIRAKDKLETREYIAEQVNKVLRERDELIKPLLAQHEELTKFRQENEFLGKFEDIKGHEKGAQISREIRQAMGNYYDSIQQKIAQNTATTEERAHAERYERATPEEYNESVASYVRERLGLNKLPVAPVTPPEPKPAPVAAVKPQPKPPVGQPAGGSNSTPTAMTEQQRHIASLRR